MSRKGLLIALAAGGAVVILVAVALVGILVWSPHGGSLFLVDRSRGTVLVYEMRGHEPGAALPDTRHVRRVILQRIDPDGRRGYIVRGLGKRRLEIVLPGRCAALEVERVKQLVRHAGHLEFRIVADKFRDAQKANFERILRLREAGKSPSDSPDPRYHRYRWYPMKGSYERFQEGSLDAWNFIYAVDREMRTVEVLVDVGDGQDVTGEDLSRAWAPSKVGDPIVQFDVKPQARGRFSRLTKPENKDRYLAIILDHEIQSAPVLRAQLSAGGIIEGYKTVRERDEIVLILNSGEMGVSLGDPIKERTVGSELGEDERK